MAFAWKHVWVFKKDYYSKRAHLPKNYRTPLPTQKKEKKYISDIGPYFTHSCFNWTFQKNNEKYDVFCY